MTPQLTWIPKRFTPGDFDGAGQERVLGRSQLSAVEMLVRETAQNSWDARLEGRAPEYRVELRKTDDLLRQDLARLLGSPANLNLAEAWSDPSLRLLEISDRGTTGLDGPYRLGLVDEPSTDNYKDLILKLGVPRSDGGGGGTYGFGKTAAYAFSRRGTLIYWTRCWHEGVLQDRLVGSAMGESFEIDGDEYTGRHWWGSPDPEGIVLPLLDEDARQVGQRIFGRGFAEGETGTSILIVDPILEEAASQDDGAAEDGASMELSEAFRASARTAIRQHLWPKLTAAGGTPEAPMTISLSVDGAAADLGSPDRGAWRYWTAALNAIRSARSGNIEAGAPAVDGFPVQLIEIKRFQEVIGHLAVIRRIRPPAEVSDRDDLDPAGLGNPYDRLALMRGQAELVVRTESGGMDSGSSGLDWIAVYKAADHRDRDYASTEPPAHDDWVAESADPAARKLVVLTRRKIKEALRDLLAPVDLTSAGSTPIATSALAHELGGLLPSPEGPSIDGQPVSGAGRHPAEPSSRGKRWKLIERGRGIVPSEDPEKQRWRIDFSIEGPSEHGEVLLQVRIDSDDSSVSLPLDPVELDTAWSGQHDTHANGTQVYAAVGRPLSVEFSGPRGRAVSANLSVKGVR